MATLEIVVFRLDAGASEPAFLDAAARTNAVLRRQAGFRSRRLSQGPDGRWADTVEWATLADALAAAEAVMKEPDFAPFAALIDPSTVVMRHEAVRVSFGP